MTYRAIQMLSTNIGLSAVILLDSITVPDSFLRIKRRFGRDIVVHAVIPIYEEELAYKLTNGTDALLKKFDAHGIDEVVNIFRVNTCL